MSSEKGLYEPKSCVGNESHEEFTAVSFSVFWRMTGERLLLK